MARIFQQQSSVSTENYSIVTYDDIHTTYELARNGIEAKQFVPLDKSSEHKLTSKYVALELLSAGNLRHSNVNENSAYEQVNNALYTKNENSAYEQISNSLHTKNDYGTYEQASNSLHTKNENSAYEQANSSLSTTNEKCACEQTKNSLSTKKENSAYEQINNSFSTTNENSTYEQINNSLCTKNDYGTYEQANSSLRTTNENSTYEHINNSLQISKSLLTKNDHGAYEQSNNSLCTKNDSSIYEKTNKTLLATDGNQNSAEAIHAVSHLTNPEGQHDTMQNLPDSDSFIMNEWINVYHGIDDGAYSTIYGPYNTPINESVNHVVKNNRFNIFNR